MSGLNWDQKFVTNPITTNTTGDLLYFARSPYGLTNDVVITWANFAAQFVGSSVLTTKGDLLGFSTANARVAVGGTNGQILQVNSANPTGLGWSTTTYPATNAINTIMYASSANVLGVITPVNSAVLVSSAGGVPSMSTTLPSGLTIPGFANAPTNTNITSMTGLTGYLQAPLGFKDSSGNILFSVNYAATPVNYLVFSNGATSVPPSITATGSDPDINLFFKSKGGGFRFQDATGTNGAQLTLVNAAGTFATSLQVSASLASDFNMQLPSMDGTPGQFLQTNGSGILSFATAGGSSPWSAGAGTNSGIGGDGTATAAGNYALSYGSSANAAGGLSAVSFGQGNTASGNFSVAIGATNTASGDYSFAIGGANIASGIQSVAMGNTNTATANYSYALGANATSTNQGSYVWSDSTAAGNTDSAANQYILTASGGYNFYVNSTACFQIATSGATAFLGTNTNDAATSGFVGEFVSSVISSGGAVSFSNGVTRNITSISLTAGDWDLWGNIFVTYSVTSGGTAGWISIASATIPDVSLVVGPYSLASATIADFGYAVLPIRLSLASTTTVYLSAFSNFSSGASTGCGGIYARRVR